MCRVDAHVAGFGPKEANGERERLTLDFDLDGRIGDQWDWSIRSRFDDSESMATTTNVINPKALGVLVGDDRTDPSNALNVFGSSFFTDSNNAVLLDSEDIHIPLQESFDHQSDGKQRTDHSRQLVFVSRRSGPVRCWGRMAQDFAGR